MPTWHDYLASCHERQEALKALHRKEGTYARYLANWKPPASVPDESFGSLSPRP